MLLLKFRTLSFSQHPEAQQYPTSTSLLFKVQGTNSCCQKLKRKTHHNAWPILWGQLSAILLHLPLPLFCMQRCSLSRDKKVSTADWFYMHLRLLVTGRVISYVRQETSILIKARRLSIHYLLSAENNKDRFLKMEAYPRSLFPSSCYKHKSHRFRKQA